jgi:DNA-binding response OmpR family regulator
MADMLHNKTKPRAATILLLASEPAIRNVIRKVLESEQYLVLSAGDLGSAMEFLNRCTPDLLMVRHHLEDSPGYDAAVYMRASLPGVPVLIVGGIPDDPGLRDREELHKFQIFPKPFAAAELVAKVKEMLPGLTTCLPTI